MPSDENKAKSTYSRSYTLYPTRLLYLTRGIKRLAPLGTAETFPKNHIIAQAEDIPSCCYLVLKGRVMAYDYTMDGSMRIYSYMEHGSILLESNMLMKQPALVNFKTTEPSVLIKITRDKLIEAMTKSPEIMMDIVESMSYKFFGTSDMLRQMTTHSVEWRLCDLLLIYADQYGMDYDGKVMISEKLTQQMMASLLSANRITIVRCLKDLKNIGIIEQINGFYCIRNVDMMKMHMEHIDKQN